MKELTDQLLNFHQVRSLTNYPSRPNIDALEKQGLYPKRFFIAGRAFWDKSEIEEFIRLNPMFNLKKSQINQEWLDAYHNQSKKEKE